MNVEPLRNYLNSLDTRGQAHFAWACGTTIGYLRKCISRRAGRIGVELVMEIERNSAGQIPAEALRPDIDWGYLRSRPAPRRRRTQAA